jgi:hypothetical protein
MIAKVADRAISPPSPLLNARYLGWICLLDEIRNPSQSCGTPEGINLPAQSTGHALRAPLPSI